MGEDSAVARYAAEFVGTFMLIFTIGCNVLSGQPVWGGVSIACVLTVMIYALGKSSGANFNPAVSVALGLTNKLEWMEVAIYSAVQIVAGICAGLCYVAMFGAAALLERIASAVDEARALYHDPTTIVTKMLADLSTIQQVGIMQSKEKLVEFVSTVPLKKQKYEYPTSRHYPSTTTTKMQAEEDQRYLGLQFLAFRRGFMKFKKLQTIVTGLNKMSAELFELDQVRGDIFVSFASDKAVSIATTIGIKVEYEELYIARGGICSHEIDTYDVNQLDIVDLGDN